MADTAFDGFTPVTSLQDTDVLIGMRGAGGINFPASALIKRCGDGHVHIPFGPSGTATEFILSLDPGATGVNARDCQIRAGNNGSNSTYLSFYTSDGAPPTQKMRISSSGNVGIGTGAPTAKLHVVGEQLVTGDFILGGSGGTQYIVRPDVVGAKDIVFAVYGGGALDGVQFNATTVRHQFDNAGSLGIGSYRWSVVYAATGSINTSDEREKVWIGIGEDRRAIWLRIARAIGAELGFYQWQDAVTEKGDDARWHFGARAQRVWSIVAAEGLCAPLIGEGVDQRPDPDWDGPPPPAMLCYDAWDAETEERPILSPSIVDEHGEPMQVGTETVVTREAGNRFGFRTDQLGLLLAWATHERLAALEAMPQAA